MKYFKFLKYIFNYLISLLYDIYYFFFGDLAGRVSGLSYYRAGKLYPDYLKNGNAAAGAVFLAQKYCRGKGVDVGASFWPLKNARPVENGKDENANNIKESDESLDFVFSSHTLEHLKDWKEALREWKRVLKPRGVLFLYLPHPMVKMWREKINKFHLWRPDPEILKNFLESELNMEIKDISYLPDGYLSFYIVAEKSR